MATDWSERVDPDEARRFADYALQITELQSRARRGGSAARGLHARAHVGLVGSLTVHSTEAALQHGPFARPQRWPAYIRFSSGSPTPRPDWIPDICGLAIKLVGVPGRKLLAGEEDALTQDFTFIQTPSLPVRDPDEGLAILGMAMRKPWLLLPWMLTTFGLRRSLAMAKAALTMPVVRSLPAARFYSAAPSRLGDGAVQLVLEPRTGPIQRPPRLLRADGLRRELVGRLREGPLRWDLVLRRFVDERTTPIEDTSVAWPDVAGPRDCIATLEIPAQVVDSERGRAIEALVESLAFNPWHTVPELRPLGAMMRARVAAYRASVDARGARPEPSEVLPCQTPGSM